MGKELMSSLTLNLTIDLSCSAVSVYTDSSQPHVSGRPETGPGASGI